MTNVTPPVWLPALLPEVLMLCGLGYKISDMAMRRETCTTCDRSLPRNQFPKAPAGSACTHDRETCKRCWHQWLAAQVGSKQWDSISCAQCANVLGQGEVRALATPATYQRYTIPTVSPTGIVKIGQLRTNAVALASA